MANTYKPLRSAYSRVFIIDGRARADHAPEYFSAMRMGGLSRNFGDVTKIEVPDPNEYGKFVQIDSIRGAVERATFNVSGRYAAAIRSRLLEMALNSCSVDVQLHIGECSDPTDFNSFTKAIIAEDVLITQHSTDDLGALESGQNALVNETANMSAEKYYEVTPMTFVTRAGVTITSAVKDIKISDSKSCGGCLRESNGCQQVFAVTAGVVGSPSPACDALISIDGGATWTAAPITGGTAAADSIDLIGTQITVVSATDTCLYYAGVDDLYNGIVPTFTKVTTGFVGAPKYIFSTGNSAFVVGASGYVYLCDDPSAGVSVLDAGAATVDNLLHVHAYDSEHALACGENGAVIYTNDGVTWAAAYASPVAAGVSLTCCWMKTETEWWVTASNGTMYYTLNAGYTWTVKGLAGTAPSKLDAIAFSTGSIAFVAGIAGNPARARMWRSYDGGYSWNVLPESATASMPAANEFYKIAVCEYDANLVFSAGIFTDAADGIIVMGS